MKSDAELQLFYTEKLKPLLEPLEAFRKERFKKIKKYLYTATISGVICLAILLITEVVSLAILLSLPILIYLGLAIQAFSDMANYLRKQFKHKIFPELLAFTFDNYEYIPNQKIAISVFEKSMLFPRHIDVVNGEDFMKFKLGETSIMFCEATALSSNDKTVFNGIFISSSFNKFFTSKTFVLPAKSTSFYQIIKQLINNFQKITLEDAEFNKEFKVLSTDQIEARYILTTSFMSRLLTYKKKINKSMSFSFVDNRLYCAISNYTNLFEPALLTPFDFDLIKRNYTPLKLYTDIVEDLNLNLRIWMKD